ncbi:uncharacterized protein DNG_08971 [Cephalotrichum gorgonifer]|uniref:Uncharacterized protein n=1 Tax=Cephalotrichum gorgonifer TaxID=2041049 RepID=A0AAE8N7G6_9PEZI|nr:uncharacterized protein DNG_08971 [Cephalotrichum gorgonifer]
MSSSSLSASWQQLVHNCIILDMVGAVGVLTLLPVLSPPSRELGWNSMFCGKISDTQDNKASAMEGLNRASFIFPSPESQYVFSDFSGVWVVVNILPALSAVLGGKELPAGEISRSPALAPEKLCAHIFKVSATARCLLLNMARGFTMESNEDNPLHEDDQLHDTIYVATGNPLGHEAGTESPRPRRAAASTAISKITQYSQNPYPNLSPLKKPSNLSTPKGGRQPLSPISANQGRPQASEHRKVTIPLPSPSPTPRPRRAAATAASAITKSLIENPFPDFRQPSSQANPSKLQDSPKSAAQALQSRPRQQPHHYETPQKVATPSKVVDDASQEHGLSFPRKRPATESDDEERVYSKPRPTHPPPATLIGPVSTSPPPPDNPQIQGPFQKKMEDAIKEAIIHKRIRPLRTLDNVHEDPFDFVYQLERREGRDYRPVVRAADDRWELLAIQDGSERFFLLVNTADFDFHEAGSICRLLADALNRWARPDDMAPSHRGRLFRPLNLTKILFVAATASTCPTKPIPMNAPVMLRPIHNSWLVRIPYIDGNFNAQMCQVAFGNAKQSVIVPEAEGIIWGQNVVSFARPLGDPPGMALITDSNEAVAPDQKTACQKVENFVRYAAGHFTRHRSPRGTPEGIRRELRNMLLSLEATIDNRRTRIYDGNTFFKCYSSSGRAYTQITQSASFNANVSMKNQEIHLSSSDQSWATSVIDDGVKAWIMSDEILEGWRAMAVSADRVNRMIRAGCPPPNACNCTAKERSTEFHACGKCGTKTLCGELDEHLDGFRACPPCRAKKPGISPIIVASRSLAYDAVVHERVRAKKGVKWNQHLENAIKERFAQDLSGSEGNWYVNAFSGRPTLSPPRARHPSRMSCDAIFPYIIDDGNAYIHHPKNVELVPMGLNLLRATGLPICLQSLSDYYAEFSVIKDDVERGDPAAARRLEVIQRSIIADFHRFTEIRRRAGISLLDRVSQDVSAEEEQYRREEWVKGDFHRAPEYVPNAPSDESDAPVSPDDVPQHATRGFQSEAGRIMSIVKEIEQYTCVTLERRNGCPLFLHGDKLPWDWNWRTVGILMSARHNRMKTGCNRHGETKDTPVTLFLECVFQACVQRMIVHPDDKDFDRKKQLKLRYSEFFGLPLTVGAWNLLSFAITHRHHGRDMFSGWAKNPRRLSDRNDALNNILIESRASNNAKSNFPEIFYPDLKEMMLEVDLPEWMANKDLRMSPYDARFEPTMDPASRGPEEEVEEFELLVQEGLVIEDVDESAEDWENIGGEESEAEEY